MGLNDSGEVVFGLRDEGITVLLKRSASRLEISEYGDDIEQV